MLTAILFALILITLATYALGGHSAAPWVPCRTHDVERFCTIAEITPDDIVLELGCGDARLTCAAARRGARAIGYEISLLPYVVGKIRTWRQPRASIQYKNFWTVDISHATVLFIFLTPPAYPRLLKKMRELTPGTRVVCYVWPLPELQPIRTEKPTGHAGLYVYSVQNRAK